MELLPWEISSYEKLIIWNIDDERLISGTMDLKGITSR
jgi:hypothetical protein